jgi:O-antigen ligase
VWLARRLTLPEDTPLYVALTTFFYVGHMVFAGQVIPSEQGILWTLVFGLYAMWRRDLRPSFHILLYPLIVYGVISTISALGIDQPKHFYGESSLWGKMALFPIAIALYRQVPRVRELALSAILFFGAYISAYGLYQYVRLAQRDLEHRISGPTSHVMTFSNLLLPISLIFLVLWVRTPRRWIFAIGTLLTTAALWLTLTRSAWFGWLAAVLVLLIAKRPRWIVIAVPLLVLFIDFMPLSLFSRLISTFDTKQSSNFDRIRMWEGGIEIIRDYPVLGVGPANVKEIYPLYRKHDAPRLRIPHLHNNVIQLWAERGIIGLAAYLLLLGLFVRECIRGWRAPNSHFAEIGIAVTVALFVAGMFEFNFGDTEVFFLMLDLFALVVVSLEPAAAVVPNAEGGTAVP